VNAKTTHSSWLTQLRGAASIYVLLHHAVRQVTIVGEHANDPLYRLIQLLTSYGHYAVDIFIVLSGYCLMLPLLAKSSFGSSLNFYLRRAVRIILPYYAALALTLILIYFVGSGLQTSEWAKHALPINSDSIWKHMLLIHQWFPNTQNNINGAFWSVGVEFQIYLLFPLFYYAGKKFGFFKTLFFITVVSYALWGVTNYFDVLNPSENGTSIYYCALFFMGVVAAHYANQQNNTEPILLWIDKYPKAIMLLAFAGIVGLAAFSFTIGYIKLGFSFPLQVQSLFVGLLVAVLFYLKGSNSINFIYFNYSALMRFLEWMGMIGFSVYLLHDPIIAIVWTYIVLPMQLPYYWLQAVVQMVVGLLVSIGIAFVFYRYVELPCHQLSKALGKIKIKNAIA
jgi:peptidoglycan/LPS O-acetylase OafA/YrhL